MALSLNDERLAKTRPRIEGALVGLAVVALAAVFFLVLLPTASKVANAPRPDPLSGWSTQRLMEGLGEYDQRIDCADLGLQGLTGYVWVKLDRLTGRPTRFLFLCK